VPCARIPIVYRFTSSNPYVYARAILVSRARSLGRGLCIANTVRKRSRYDAPYFSPVPRRYRADGAQNRFPVVRRRLGRTDRYGKTGLLEQAWATHPNQQRHGHGPSTGLARPSDFPSTWKRGMWLSRRARPADGSLRYGPYIEAAGRAKSGLNCCSDGRLFDVSGAWRTHTGSPSFRCKRDEIRSRSYWFRRVRYHTVLRAVYAFPRTLCPAKHTRIMYIICLFVDNTVRRGLSMRRA